LRRRVKKLKEKEKESLGVEREKSIVESEVRGREIVRDGFKWWQGTVWRMKRRVEWEMGEKKG
jgi:hypothetical protein